MTRDEKKAYNAAYRALAHGKCAAAQRRWRLANLERCAEAQRERRRLKGDVVRAYDRERYARDDRRLQQKRAARARMSPEDRELENRMRRIKYNLKKRAGAPS